MIFEKVVEDLLDSEYLKGLERYPSHRFSSKLVQEKNRRRDHCIRVGYLSFYLCKLLGGDARICARAGVLHDVGYDHQQVHKPLSQIFGHARKGATIAQRIGEHPRVVEVIKTHMYPIGGAPRSREAFIVWIADKLDAFLEILQLSKLIETKLQKIIK
ncbi:MAG: HD domain-containing protein [Candidatus Jordarchaeum sp.]|uniref:HD domain-containing protein n=1 Tax=Candidatus Jordarchaeum sp. TaxID=2823881 RepID=UPI00404AB5B2